MERQLERPEGFDDSTTDEREQNEYAQIAINSFSDIAEIVSQARAEALKSPLSPGVVNASHHMGD